MEYEVVFPDGTTKPYATPSQAASVVAMAGGRVRRVTMGPTKKEE